jgi:hypothetical protein
LPGKTRPVPKNEYRSYLVKATEFARTMENAHSAGDWTSTGLAAVHCVISANDALLAYFGGIRSISPSHDDAALILVDTLAGTDVRSNATHLRRVIAQKNLIEYESRLFTAAEAAAALKHAQRFLVWATNKLPKQK